MTDARRCCTNQPCRGHNMQLTADDRWIPSEPLPFYPTGIARIPGVRALIDAVARRLGRRKGGQR